MMKKQITIVALLLLCTSFLFAQTFEVMLPSSISNKPLDGRLLLLFSKSTAGEPRFQISDDEATQQVFGMDVDQWKPGTKKQFDASAFGYPVEPIKQIANGNYRVQVVLHIYETFKRKDGHVVKLPMDRGEGQHWNIAPGNLYSTTQDIKYTPETSFRLMLNLDQKIPPIKEPEDSKYVKHIKIQSKLLTEFWGRPMYLGAHILLPEGWETHLNVKYPLAIYHGHFPDDFGGWRTTPPDENLVPDTVKRFNLIGYNKIVQQEAYDFYKMWTGPDFPRVIAIEIQHANPFYVGSSRVDLQACKLEYSIVSPK